MRRSLWSKSQGVRRQQGHQPQAKKTTHCFLRYRYFRILFSGSILVLLCTTCKQHVERTVVSVCGGSWDCIIHRPHLFLGSFVPRGEGDRLVRTREPYPYRSVRDTVRVRCANGTANCRLRLTIAGNWRTARRTTSQQRVVHEKQKHCSSSGIGRGIRLKRMERPKRQKERSS